MAKKQPNNEQSIPSPFTPNATDLYHDAMTMLEEGTLESGLEALKLLSQAYTLEMDSVEVQIGLVNAYGLLGIDASVHAHIERAYRLTKALFPTWPEQLEWGKVDNRAYLRAIHYQADLFHDRGEVDSAMELYQLLLTLDPNDNQGIRYLVAGHYAGLTGAEVNALFDEGNDTQDWSKLEELLHTQNATHNFWTPPPGAS